MQHHLFTACAGRQGMNEVASNIDNILESIEADAILGIHPVFIVTQALIELQAAARHGTLPIIQEQTKVFDYSKMLLGTN